MPILKPDIQRALRAAVRDAGIDNTEGNETVSELMDKKDMSMSQILDDLKDFIDTSTNEPLRLRAIETALKMKGALKDTAQSPIPSITILIQDQSGSSVNGVNPILVPRPSGLRPTSIQ
jgi:hypothetical protein